MQIYQNQSLKPFHTFGLEVHCQHMVKITSVSDLRNSLNHPELKPLSKLMLGKGSNVLFTEDFRGVVLLNQLMGKSVTESEEYFHLHVSGGEDWPQFVEWTLEQGYSGLENLALIPGCVGSAPIQNIGAYGVELKDVCEYVDYYCHESDSVIRLSNEECQFGYRDSVFKKNLKDKATVVAVGFLLKKDWKPNVEYGPLKALDIGSRTARNIFERVCDIRRSKLPDPAVLGNAGSFFKNPVISKDQFDRLQALYPEMVGYNVGEQVKVAAGWLIDHAGLKGTEVGGAQVHPDQALVLVNTNNAIPVDILKLAALVRDKVQEKYQIRLEHEVRFIGSHKETNLTECLEKQHES
ncbi:UDP-N-acetylenolpyruvoylglucosamine reductase [Vibrio nigripulchritudo SO65]|uniref:UDP-N-acetylmuramate dehydrogenase n=1 Tax=Vibrio nigripulchritudo TaxID=28173 RepID=UPI0003B19718|nr:UDP-N-acetylmuramate dehydrogenase [Vibrio nigripulchritudo]CCN34157.1 UDP-N-acetylenolpyruvoylglucosamine reductase [Vibrio nigripulchritudo AM115]CCN40967.1 UDP-N-acetylenolpyruvoylglucosamine reductase [Vibrio nigripulchritudo FTn2]CCN63396.1 UDP-N-acetylenolpyruvoylglucosamine reductase [Vibrio nigripulchritudo POn4]CCN76324.1 UDP-N-acetylenolpyruvoylglucosamine reductase [Vibrio nigripulchritudo SO65]